MTTLSHQYKNLSGEGAGMKSHHPLIFDTFFSKSQYEGWHTYISHDKCNRFDDGFRVDVLFFYFVYLF